MLQSLAQLDSVDPAFPIVDEGIGVQRHPREYRPFILRRQLARDYVGLGRMPTVAVFETVI